MKIDNLLQYVRPAGLGHGLALTSSKTVQHSTSSLTYVRKLFLGVLTSSALLLAQNVAGAQTLHTEKAAKGGALINSAGVVTHLTYVSTSYYTNFNGVFTALKNSGIKHIRDGFFNTAQFPQVTNEHHQLAAAGIRTSYVVPYDTSISSANIQQLAHDTGDVDSIEAPNECDVLGQCGGGGSAGINNVIGFLPMLHTAAQDIGAPLVGPAFALQTSYPIAGNLDSLLSLNNLHLYFGGRNPGSSGWGDFDAQGYSYGSFNYWLDLAAQDAPGKASQITETGYMAWPSTGQQYTVPESVESKYIPRTLLLAFMKGFDKVYFYQLIDDPTSPQGYGLLRNDFSEKPGFTALKSLFGILADNDWAKFTPGSLNFAISGGDSNLKHLLLQKSDNTFYLVLWVEKPSWDVVNVAPISVGAQNIGITLDSNHKTVTDFQFNNTGKYVGFNQPMKGNLASITVTDQISIVKIVHR